MLGAATALLEGVMVASLGGCPVGEFGGRLWIILDSNDQRILLKKTGRAIIFLVGSIPIVFTGDIRF
jgi:hypothetical protein